MASGRQHRTWYKEHLRRKRMRVIRRWLIGVGAAAVVLAMVFVFAPRQPAIDPALLAEDEAYRSARAAERSAAAQAAIKTPASLAPVREVLAGADPLTLSVLGDSTGNSTGEWVDLYAQHIAQDTTVVIHLWDEKAEDWRPDARTYGNGSRQVTIWNGSMPGALADYPQDKIKTIVPERPDALILNYGHNGSASDISGYLNGTVDAAVELWGDGFVTAAVVQNAASGERATITDSNQDALRSWALNEGVPLIDVRAVFDKAPDLDALLLDDGTGLHPNGEGQRLWADTMIGALG